MKHLAIVALLLALVQTQTANSQRRSQSGGLSQALAMVRAGQYAQAAPLLYQYSRNLKGEDRLQVKYILGTALLELKLPQIAAFQFVDVVREGKSKYLRPSIDKLSIAADILGNDTLLNYAISKVNVNEFPADNRDIIYFRLGEIRLKNGEHAKAAELFAKVPSASRYFSASLFNRGLAYLESNRPKQAIPVFQNLLNLRARAAVTDSTKVAARMALARSYYQAQNWDAAIQSYREIPRDHEYWHQAVFENSWALFRAAKFRSALSQFHTLHSSYYEDVFNPESLILRGIVYLYICKFDEMEKVLGLFDQTYIPVRNMVHRFYTQNRDYSLYFNEIESYLKNKSKSRRLPSMVVNSIIEQGDIKRELQYLERIQEERQRLDAMTSISRTSLANAGRKILNQRTQNTKLFVGELARIHLGNLRDELVDLFEQAGFARYEMINGKKEQFRKRLAGKDLPSVQIDDDISRTYYVQNGYEYWPFRGEYWLNELGNYQYVGRQSCE